jgi:hypothetical protein
MNIYSNYMRLWRVIENFGLKEFEALSKPQREVVANLALNRRTHIILDDSNTLSLISISGYWDTYSNMDMPYFIQNGKQVLRALRRKDILVPNTHTKEGRVQYALGLSDPGFVLHPKYYKKPKRLCK